MNDSFTLLLLQAESIRGSRKKRSWRKKKSIEEVIEFSGRTDADDDEDAVDSVGIGTDIEEYDIPHFNPLMMLMMIEEV